MRSWVFSGTIVIPLKFSWVIRDLLPLGGVIGLFAIISKQEISLIIVGGIFVMEALSVVIQVVSFRSRGKRVFKMTPLHHHFELSGWKESQVVVRFWILAIIFALFTLITLKIR